MNPLPTDVLAALQDGNTIEAIKRLRQATGLGLKEAKDAIDAHLAGLPVSISVREAGSGLQLPADVLAALREGNKIEAIRLLREHTGLGLKEAKDAVDAWGGASAPRLSPGEQPRSSGAGWWVLGLVLLAALGYAFLSGA